MELLLVGDMLQLAAPALFVVRAGRGDPIRRRNEQFPESTPGPARFFLRDPHPDLIARSGSLHKHHTSIGQIPDPGAVGRQSPDLHGGFDGLRGDRGGGLTSLARLGGIFGPVV